jgi:HAD superfamily hydrolase (TIGR01509 family)
LDGANRLLHACRRRGWRVVLASSAKEDELSAMREALDAEEAIYAVTGASDVQSSKPAPDLVRRALERAGVPADRAIFVGDTRWDVEAALRAGVPCIGLLSGGWSRAELEQAGAVEVYEGPGELLGKLDGSVLAEPPGA